MSKVCTKCGVEKDESEFYKKRACKCGLSASCKMCESEYSRRHYAENIEKRREKLRTYRQENLERVRSLDRANRLLHREKRTEANRAYKQTNREKLRERQRIYVQANLEKVRERDKVYWSKNREKLREQKRIDAKNQSSKLSDRYVKHLLKVKIAPQELIDLKRAHIQIQRFIKEKEKNNA